MHQGAFLLDASTSATIYSLTILALSLLCLTSNAQLLWKISGNGIKKPSYIVGSHHACTFQYCDSIPGLMKAFEKVDYVIGEYDMVKSQQMTPEETMKLKSMMMMPADTSFASLFTEDEKSKLDEFLKLKLGVPSDMLATLKPMAIMITVHNIVIVIFRHLLHENLPKLIQVL